jgi:TPR repeat protein
MISDGEAVPIATADAHGLFVRSCDLGDGRGCYNAAMTLLWGVDVAQDMVAARGYFQRACSMGVDKSCSTLAWMYDWAWGGRRDAKRAREAADLRVVLEKSRNR